MHIRIISLDKHRHFIQTWMTKRCQHCRDWVHPCSSLKADWVFLPTTWHKTLRLLPQADGLAWQFFLAWLAQNLMLIKVPNSRTYKSHKYTSQPKQHITWHSNYICIYAHSRSLPMNAGELKRSAGPKYFCRVKCGQMRLHVGHWT